MNFTINFSSFGDIAAAFKTPDEERRIDGAYVNVRVQRRSSSGGDDFHLRFGGSGSVNYKRLTRRDAEALRDALTDILD